MRLGRAAGAGAGEAAAARPVVARAAEEKAVVARKLRRFITVPKMQEPARDGIPKRRKPDR